MTERNTRPEANRPNYLELYVESNGVSKKIRMLKCNGDVDGYEYNADNSPKTQGDAIVLLDIFKKKGIRASGAYDASNNRYTGITVTDEEDVKKLLQLANQTQQQHGGGGRGT